MGEKGVDQVKNRKRKKENIRITPPRTPALSNTLRRKNNRTSDKEKEKRN